MTTEFVSMPTNWTVEQALGYIREVGEREGDRLRDLRARPDEPSDSCTSCRSAS